MRPESKRARARDPAPRPAEGSDERLSLLFSLIRIGTAATEVSVLVDQVLLRMITALRSDVAELHLCHDGRLALAGHHRTSEDPASGRQGGGREPPSSAPIDGSTLAGLTALSKRTQVVSAGSWPPGTRSEVERDGLLHGIAAPLLAQDQLVGTFHLLRRADTPFSSSEVELVETCSAYVALAIERARLFEAERHQVEDLRLLLETGRAVTGSLDLDQTLDHAAHNLARLLDASHAFIWLLEPGTGELRGVVTSAEEHQAHFSSVRLTLDDPSLAAQAVKARAPVQAVDALRSASVNQDLNARYVMKSLLALPLLIRGEPIGSAVVGDELRVRTWTDAEVERATVMAGQVAVAVANARLFEHLKKSYDALERTQEELVKRERLAALGELAAVVAHEVRNPLGVIFNSVASLRRLLKPAGEAELLFSIVSEEAERLNTMVGDLLDFARPNDPQLLREPLEPIALGAVKMTAGAAAANTVEVVLDIPSDLAAPVDARMLRQALVNLLLNAIQAMPRGGAVSLRARQEGTGVHRQLHIQVIDTGPGISQDLADRIFQPFFTTRATGSGLGLAVVKRIADAHGGDVKLESTSGPGATFALSLPMRAPMLRR